MHSNGTLPLDARCRYVLKYFASENFEPLTTLVLNCLGDFVVRLSLAFSDKFQFRLIIISLTSGARFF